MTKECLGYINQILDNSSVPYEFAEWTADEVPSVYFVGEYSEEEPQNEDGLHESTFIITGTTSESWLLLENYKKTIADLFPSVGGRRAMLSNGSAVAIFYDSAFPVPTDVMDLKRIQINLTIKEWMVK